MCNVWFDYKCIFSLHFGTLPEVWLGYPHKIKLPEGNRTGWTNCQNQIHNLLIEVNMPLVFISVLRWDLFTLNTDWSVLNSIFVAMTIPFLHCNSNTSEVSDEMQQSVIANAHEGFYYKSYFPSKINLYVISVSSGREMPVCLALQSVFTLL